MSEIDIIKADICELDKSLKELADELALIKTLVLNLDIKTDKVIAEVEMLKRRWKKC